jgi:hypothetical protein
MKVTRAMAIGVAGGTIGRQVVKYAVEYERFIADAMALGLTAEQAKTLFDDEVLKLGGWQEGMEGARLRLQLLIENGYLVVALRDLLDAKELAAQPFEGGTVLNHWLWMTQPFGYRFAQMEREEQRAMAKAAIELATISRWNLEKAMATLMGLSA